MKTSNRKSKDNLAILCVFFVSTLMVLSCVCFTRAQSSLVNFRWLGDTGLALCGQPENSDQWETLKSWGVKATVNLRSEAQDDEVYLDSIGIEYYYLPIINNGASGSWNLTEEQNEAPINWINSKLAEGKKVLIHCHLGQNRAPTLAMMWYIHEGHTANEAYTWVLQYPVSAPFDYQKQCAVDYYTWLQQPPTPTQSPPVPTPTAIPTPNPPTPASTSTPTTITTPTPAPTLTFNPTPPPSPAPEDFPTILVVSVSGASLIGVGLLIHSKKRRR
jgi:hypothetical protein